MRKRPKQSVPNCALNYAELRAALVVVGGLLFAEQDVEGVIQYRGTVFFWGDGFPLPLEQCGYHSSSLSQKVLVRAKIVEKRGQCTRAQNFERRGKNGNPPLKHR